MRWFVEISALGVKPGTTTTLCVEAPQWQPALQKARILRGDEGPLGNFSIELLEDGFRAIDPVSRLRYLVKRAPDDAALTNSGSPEEAVAPKVEAAAPIVPELPPQRPLAQTMAFSSEGSAMVTEPGKAAATSGRKRGPAQTIGFSSVGAASIQEAVAKVDGARANAPVAPAPAPTPTPAPVAAAPVAAAPVAAASDLPDYTLVNEREDNPSERSPLSYREYVYAVATGTTDGEAKRLILDRFEAVQKSLEQARPGKLINLAIFDHSFAGRPLRRPLVTLTWKDWKSEAPELQFPSRDGVSMVPPSSSLPAGPLSTPPPSARAPVSVAPVSVASAAPPVSSPSPVATPVSVAPASAPAPSSKATTPTPKSATVSTKAAATPASAKASTRAATVPRPAAAAATKATPSAPKKRLSGEDLLTALFEAFNDLHFLRDAIEGAEFVLALTLEKLPSAVGMVSLFDMNKREFVIVRQTGGVRAVGLRQPERSPIAANAMRTRHAVVISDPAEAKGATDDRFKVIGVEIRSLICAPVELNGRYLGLIELVNPLDGSLFNEGDGNALTYIGQQFAEFAAARGVMIDPEQLKESAGAPKSTPASSKRR